MNRLPAAALLSACLFAACSGTPPESSLACPPAERAQAFALSSEEPFLSGVKAVGTKGDYLLRSDKASFVISGIDRGTTYYHYGGILVDAAPTERCRQVADDQFEEMGLLFGKLDLADFSASTLRAFRGQQVEIVNDGSDGKAAHVRVRGVDDHYWLVEYELIRQKFHEGGVKPLSQPYGVEVIVDYRLPPGASTLQIDFSVRNLGDETHRFMVGPEMIFGDRLRVARYGNLSVAFGGFSLLGAIPFLTAGSPHGSYAMGMQDARMSQTNVSGVDAVLDLDQALTDPLTVAPGETSTMTLFFAAGPTDDHSAAKQLQPYLAEPLPKWTWTMEPFGGRTVDTAGNPVSGATVEVQMQNPEGAWHTLERYFSDAEGRFGDSLSVFEGSGTPYRVVAHTPGRQPTEPLAFDAPPAEPLQIELKAEGRIDYRIVDGTGAPLPARISLFRAGEQVKYFFVRGEGSEPVPPGAYEVSVTHGWEYGTHQGTLTVPEDGAYELKATLHHLVDTSGYLSADTHTHQEPSADSTVLLHERILSAAGEGLEVPVATDHEIIHGLEAAVAASGLQSWVNSVSGEEFTATVPEHMTIFPVVPDGTPRGSPPVWYQHGLDEAFGNAYSRGAQVAFLNHPRGGCNWMCIIGYDRVAGAPTLDDPTRIGLDADQSLWTWNFHGIEYMNGPKNPFLDPAHPDRTGLFDDWLSFLNHGHRITAVGASDEHGFSELGMPRIYFGVIEDRPELFHPDQLVDAVHRGDVLVSTGAFARITVNGKTMGDVITDKDGSVDVGIRIEALPEVDVARFRIYVNCDEVLKAPTDAPGDVVKHDQSYAVAVTADAHIVVAGFSDEPLPRGLPQFNPRNVPRFTSNAIYVDADGNGTYDAPGGKACNYTLD